MTTPATVIAFRESQIRLVIIWCFSLDLQYLWLNQSLPSMPPPLFFRLRGLILVASLYCYLRLNLRLFMSAATARMYTLSGTSWSAVASSTVGGAHRVRGGLLDSHAGRYLRLQGCPASRSQGHSSSLVFPDVYPWVPVDWPGQSTEIGK